MRFFEENIRALSSLDPELASAVVAAKAGADLQLVTTKTGRLSLKAGDIALHSLYDPVREAEAWVEYHRESIQRASQLVVLGFGLGYHIIELCKRTPTDVVVVEPRLDVLKTAIESIDLTSVLSRVRILTGNDLSSISKGFTVLEHKPSMSLNSGYFDALYSKLRALKAAKECLRIMVVGPIYGGSLPIAEYCTHALREMGHEVEYVDNSRYRDTYFGIDALTQNKSQRSQLRSLLVDFISETIMTRCEEFKPDFLFALAQAPFTHNALVRLRDLKVVTAFWFVEDFRHLTYWQSIAPFYNYFFVIQKGEFFKRLRDIGANNFSYLPLAACPDVHRKLELSPDELAEYGSDVSFMGAGYYNRRLFFQGLLGFDFKIWGSEWDLNSPLGKCVQRNGERIETEEIVKIFNATKININLHSSTYHEGINPYGDFLNPRTFEVAACGGFQLVDCRPELAEFFEPGKEIICFNSLDDLKRKIRYYLNNPEERQEIAERARARVLKEHTYRHRMEEMLNFVLKHGFELPPWAKGKHDIGTLLQRAGSNTELGKYLAGFIGRGRVGFPEIVEEIASKEGKLSDVEKIFLLMREIKEIYTSRDVHV
jgi:spore maturation protein CgeB